MRLPRPRFWAFGFALTILGSLLGRAMIWTIAPALALSGLTLIEVVHVIAAGFVIATEKERRQDRNAYLLETCECSEPCGDWS
jgi:hypothetical protein